MMCAEKKDATQQVHMAQPFPSQYDVLESLHSQGITPLTQGASTLSHFSLKCIVFLHLTPLFS